MEDDPSEHLNDTKFDVSFARKKRK